MDSTWRINLYVSLLYIVTGLRHVTVNRFSSKTPFPFLLPLLSPPLPLTVFLFQSSAPRGSRLSVLFYFLLPDSNRGELSPEYSTGNSLSGLRGYTAELGQFTVRFRLVASAANEAKLSHLVTFVPREDLVSQEVMRGMGIAAEKVNMIRLLGRMPLPAGARENLVVFEATAVGQFALEVQFESASAAVARGDATPLSGPAYRRELEARTAAFDARFANVFPTIVRDHSGAQVKAAKLVLSSLIGGIGYFYGESIVQSDRTPQPVRS